MTQHTDEIQIPMRLNADQIETIEDIREIFKMMGLVFDAAHPEFWRIGHMCVAATPDGQGGYL